MQESDSITGSSRHEKARIEVEVRNIADAPVDDASVTLSGYGGGRPAASLPFDKRTAAYAGMVAPGRYTVTVSSPSLESQARDIQVQPAGGRELFVLGRQGLPFYFRAKVKVPFEPHPDLIGVLLRSAAATVDAELDAAVKGRELEPVAVSEEIRRARGRLYRAPAAWPDERKQAMLRQIASLRSVEHAGPIVSRREQSLSLLTNELVVRFEAHVTEETVRRIAEELRLDLLRDVPYSPNTFHFRWPEPPSYRMLDVATRLAARDDVEWAEPNLVTTAELDAVTPADFLWNGVWDRQLVRCPDAWQRLQDAGLQPFGEPTIIIAAVDQGIQSAGGVPSHPEFQGNVSNGATKIYRLFDFINLVANNDNPIGDHGMGVSGVAGAGAGNASPVAGQTEGLAGSAPNCRMMGLIFPGSEVDQADMYIWAAGFNPNSPRVGFPAAISPGADVFTTSIGFGAGAPISGVARAMIDYLTTYGRGGKGCMLFFSTGNNNINFTTSRPWAAYERSFGMAASTLANDGVTEIRAPYSGFGPVALCAPSHDQYPILHNPPANYGTWSADLVGTGNLIGHATAQTTLTAAAAAGATTVTVAGVAGIANGDRLLLGAPGSAGSEPVTVTAPPNVATSQITVTALLNAHAAGDAVFRGANDYRNNFGGTSSATPLAAGVAALVLSAEPSLTWIEARQILRDTAVRIDAANVDPIGQWLDANGNPAAASGQPPVYSQWFGFGRIDADRAVEEALDYAFTRDLMVRENLADLGTVPSGGVIWNSPDIWVRNVDPAVEGAAGQPASYASAPPHQPPIAGQTNWIYARFRNIGADPSLDFYVRIYLTHWPGLEFTYPASFIPSIRPGAAVPSPLVPGTYLIGEVKYSGLAAGASDIVSVPWPAPMIPPATVMVGMTTVQWHPCLLLEISPHDGPAPSGNRVWDDNNLAQKNISIVYPDAQSDFAMAAVMGSPENRSRFLTLEIERYNLPPQVKLYVDLVDPKLKAPLRTWLTEPEAPGDDCEGCTVTLLEPTKVRLDCGGAGRTGGLVMMLPAQATLSRTVAPALPRNPRHAYTLGHYRGREVAFVASHGTTRIPVLAVPGAHTVVIVGGYVQAGARKGQYLVGLTQRDATGAVSGAVGLEVHVR